jgi:DTW domain-containing protein
VETQAPENISENTVQSTGQNPEQSVQHRDLCLKCFRARNTCFCAAVVPVRPEIEIVILLHPLERRRSIGTARMTHLCLTNSRIISGVSFKNHPAVKEILQDPKKVCFLLYPGPKSMNVEEQLPPEMIEAKRQGLQVVVFVIDGTWACAKRMLRLSTNLQALPRISFHPSKTSEYQIRKQPESYCLSTVEAVHRVLGILEPSLDASNLLHVFRELVKTQLSYSGVGPLRKPRRT